MTLRRLVLTVCVLFAPPLLGVGEMARAGFITGASPEKNQPTSHSAPSTSPNGGQPSTPSKESNQQSPSSQTYEMPSSGVPGNQVPGLPRLNHPAPDSYLGQGMGGTPSGFGAGSLSHTCALLPIDLQLASPPLLSWLARGGRPFLPPAQACSIFHPPRRIG